MITLLFAVYLLGAFVFAAGGFMSGKDSKDESTAHFIALVFIVAVGWPLWIVLLFVFFMWWGIVGD